MAEIFGFDEKEFFRRLKDVLNEVERKQKERDKDGEPRPIMSGPVKLLTVEDTFDRLGIIAYLDGEPVERIHMRIGIS